MIPGIEYVWCEVFSCFRPPDKYCPVSRVVLVDTKVFPQVITSSFTISQQYL